MTRSLDLISAGPPSAIFSPRSSTVMRSETRMTTLMSCSMSSTDTFFSSRTRCTKSVNTADSRGFMPAVGSSSSSTTA